MKQLWRAIANEEAVTAVEYAVMLALILAALLGSAALVGEKAGGLWAGIQTNLTDTLK